MALPFDVKRLSEHYDPDSRQAYLTLYADLSDPRHLDTVRKRHREIRAAMPTPTMRASLDEAMERAIAGYERAKKGHDSRAVAVFVGPNGLLEAHGLQAQVSTRLVFDSSPYVAPLARFADDNEAFVLVLLDSEHAAIFVVWGAKSELRKELETSLIGRHRHGGMSQMRFQRHRRGQVNQFYDHVAEHLATIVAADAISRIAVAGPGTAKHDFRARLSQELARKVVLEEDVDFKDGPADDALVRRFVTLMRDEEEKASLRWLEALRRELTIGELAITGALECANQAAAGRVERLIILGGATMPGAKCEQHQEVFPRSGACHCGAKGADVDLINEAVEFTARSDGQSEFVNAPEAFLTEAGGIGALLRW